MRSTPFAKSVLAVTPVIWGAGTLVGANAALGRGLTIEGIAPLAIVMWQQLALALVLVPVLAFTRARAVPTRAELRYGLLLGAASTTIPGLVGLFVMPHIGVALYVALFTLSPTCTFLLRWAVERSYPGHRRLAGIAIGALGAWLLVRAGIGQLQDGFGWLLVALAAPASLAMGNLVRERMRPAGSGMLHLAASQPVAQLFLLAPLALALDIEPALPTGFDPPGLLLLAMAAVTVFIQPMFHWLQSRTDAIGVSQIGYVAFVIASVAGGFAFGEAVPLTAVPAIALLFAGQRLAHASGGIAGRPSPSRPTSGTIRQEHP